MNISTSESYRRHLLCWVREVPNRDSKQLLIYAFSASPITQTRGSVICNVNLNSLIIIMLKAAVELIEGTINSRNQIF